ncbi:unnamed protein product [Brassica oleracea var. botrytis]
MADSAPSSEASLCLSGLSFCKVFMIESFEVTRLLRVRLAVSVSSLHRGVAAQR